MDEWGVNSNGFAEDTYVYSNRYSSILQIRLPFMLNDDYHPSATTSGSSPERTHQINHRSITPNSIPINYSPSPPPNPPLSSSKMFLLLLLLTLSLLPPPLHAHCKPPPPPFPSPSTHLTPLDSFAHLITPSTPSSPAWTYIRQPGFPSSTETTGEWQPGKPGAPLGSIIPPSVDQSLRATPLSSRHVSSPEFRCGREGWKEHDQTGTADVRGGEVVGVGVEVFWSVS